MDSATSFAGHERMSRPSKNYLQVQITVEDPQALARPWTSAPRNWTLTSESINEYYCTDNPDVSEFEKIKEGEKAKRGFPIESARCDTGPTCWIRVWRPKPTPWSGSGFCVAS
jgi:hypothetical protein